MSAEDTPLCADVALQRPLGFALNLRLRLPRGVTVLVGPSGAGKSTTLDILAGHVRPDRGRIELYSDVLFERESPALPPRIDVAVQKRRVGYVMQSPSLFPHLDAHHNMAYGLAGWPRPQREARLSELTAALGLSSLLSRYPRALSGGERQKVALARALAPRPRALLLDEPLSAVDLPQRDGLLHRLGELLAALDIPVLYVTHSIEEQRFFAARSPAGRALCLRPHAAGGGVEVADF